MCLVNENIILYKMTCYEKKQNERIDGKRGGSDNSPKNPLSTRPTLGILSHGFQAIRCGPAPPNSLANAM